jgi:hypothetical protein
MQQKKAAAGICVCVMDRSIDREGAGAAPDTTPRKSTRL